MKKLLIYLSIIVILFAGLYIVNQQSSKSQDEALKDNPYGVAPSKLHPETVAQLKDPNYQNIILPNALDQKISKKESFFLYYFGSNCPHCKVTTPVLVPLEKELQVDVKQLNLLEFQEGWKKYNIEATPTLVYYKNGVEADRIVGGIPEAGGGQGNTPEQFKQFFLKYKGN